MDARKKTCKTKTYSTTCPISILLYSEPTGSNYDHVENILHVYELSSWLFHVNYSSATRRIIQRASDHGGFLVSPHSSPCYAADCGTAHTHVYTSNQCSSTMKCRAIIYVRLALRARVAELLLLSNQIADTILFSLATQHLASVGSKVAALEQQRKLGCIYRPAGYFAMT